MSPLVPVLIRNVQRDAQQPTPITPRRRPGLLKVSSPSQAGDPRLAVLRRDNR
jgi:hypothetical protein